MTPPDPQTETWHDPADVEPKETVEAWRWAVSALPWFLFVGCLALAEGLSGCAPVEEPVGDDDDTPSTYGDDDDATGDDDDAIGGPYPAVFGQDPDATGVSRIKPLWVDFSEEVDAAELSLALAGEPVPGTPWQVGAVRFLFMPESALDGDTTYTATVTWGADDSFSWDFTTAPARPTVGDPAGVTISWDIQGGAASSPPGAEGFIGALPLSMLTEVAADGAILGGLTTQGEEEIAQDLCVPTFEPASSTWADPLLETPGSVVRLTVDLSIAGYGIAQLTLREARFQAELAADADGITGLAEGSFFAVADLREVAIPGLCETLAGVAIECTACPGDGEPECMVLALEDIAGDAVDVDVVPRAAADVKADPACLPDQTSR